MATAAAAAATAAAASEKTAEELRKEIDELHRQQREITERLRDPRGLRRAGAAPRSAAAPPLRPRGFVRPGPTPEEQPAPKRRLLSAVVKVEGGEPGAPVDDTTKEQDSAAEAAPPPPPPGHAVETNIVRPRAPLFPINGSSPARVDGFPRPRRNELDLPLEPLPRVLPKNEDPSLVKRNQRMFGQLLGTLQKFQQEDQKFSSTKAYKDRSDSLARAEQKAREETERLRQQEREQIAEKRRRDLTLRARVAAKAEEKKLELLFINWTEHHKMLSNFLRTKTEPAIYYMPSKPLLDDPAVIEQQKEQVFLEWKSTRRAELSDYQKQVGEQYIANVEVDLQRWQNGRNARRGNNLVNLQETMDKELETHRLEHGPKTRRIPGSNDEEEDVEDIVAEDELMDEVLQVQQERIGGDITKPAEIGNESPNPADMH